MRLGHLIWCQNLPLRQLHKSNKCRDLRVSCCDISRTLSSSAQQLHKLRRSENRCTLAWVLH